MSQQAFLERMSSVKDTTPSERKLVRYLEKEYPTLAFDNLESLGAKAGVGKSTVSRFIARLGYPNFRTFLQEVRQEMATGLNTPIKRYAARSKKPAPAETLLRNQFEAVGESLGKTLDRIGMADFSRALDLVCDETRPLYLMASSSSAHLLGYFATLADYMRPGVIRLNSDAPVIARQAAVLDPSAVLMAMAHGRYATVTSKVMQHFHERGHETILITNSYSAPPLVFATVPLVVCSEDGNMFQSRCAAIAVLETLIEGMSEKFGPGIPERYAAINGLLRHLDVYPQ